MKKDSSSKEMQFRMSDIVRQNYYYAIPADQKTLIAMRYHAVTRAVNKVFWNSVSDTVHSFYVGSYGRGTATKYSDIDVLMELPQEQFDRYDARRGNGQSQLLGALREAVQQTYARTEIHADGQIVKLLFSDGMKFELLPALRHETIFGTVVYQYPDSNMGGKWLTANPKAEQAAIKKKDDASNGLLRDTCKHIRCIHQEHFRSYHLSGIVIDSFVYHNIGDWHRVNPSAGEEGLPDGDYETFLLNKGLLFSHLWKTAAPGSDATVDIGDSKECLIKILKRMAGGES